MIGLDTIFLNDLETRRVNGIADDAVEVHLLIRISNLNPSTEHRLSTEPSP